ncbi:MAG: VWA domain-containing protein [Burkholderiales bacterium]|nr:VWA domain-containing protein [Burkholderiales bacterium]
MERTLTRFVRSLRSAGMQVSSAEAIDAARALALVGYADREAMKSSLRIVMSKSEEDDAVFGDLFDTFFSAVQADRQAQAQQQAREAEAGQQEGAEQAQPSSGSPSEGERAGSPSSGGPSDADAFMTLAQSGDATAISVAMARAATAAGADDIRFASQTAFFVRKMLEQLGVQQVEAQLQAALAERGADARRRAQAIIEARAAMQKHARSHVEQRFEMFGRSATESFLDEVVTQREIGELSHRDMERMKVLIARMAKRLAVRHSRPRRVRNRGAIDVRRTLRANAGIGGVPFDLVWKTKKKDRPKIVAICDVSGSVAQYVKFLLLFLHALNEKVTDLEAFAFSARLYDVGRTLERMDFEQAMDRIVRDAGGGSTDYGQALMDLQSQSWDVIDRRTTVIVLGDGRSNDSDPRLDIFSELADRCRRLVWLCPEPPRRWGTGDSCMLQYEPFCSQLSYCATASDLERAVDEVLSAYD